MRKIHVGGFAAASVLTLTLGCASTPTGGPVKTRPMKGGDVDTGAGSVESERRRLQGTWQLTDLQVFSPSGQPLAAQATGTLRYDEFGNLSMHGKVTGGPDVESSVLNVTGRVVLDPAAHALRFQSMTAANGQQQPIDPQLDAKLVRYYEFVGDLLKTTVKASDGATTATATWKRIN
jgi:hypothetical protein